MKLYLPLTNLPYTKGDENKPNIKPNNIKNFDGIYFKPDSVDASFNHIEYDTAYIKIDKTLLDTIDPYQLANLKIELENGQLQYWWVDEVQNLGEDLYGYKLSLDYWLTYWVPIQQSFNGKSALIERSHVDRIIRKAKGEYAIDYTPESNLYAKDEEFSSYQNYITYSLEFGQKFWETSGNPNKPTQDILDYHGNDNKTFIYAIISPRAITIPVNTDGTIYPIPKPNTKDDIFNGQDLPQPFFIAPVFNDQATKCDDISDITSNKYRTLFNNPYVINFIQLETPLILSGDELREYNVEDPADASGKPIFSVYALPSTNQSSDTNVGWGLPLWIRERFNTNNSELFNGWLKPFSDILTIVSPSKTTPRTDVLEPKIFMEGFHFEVRKNNQPEFKGYMNYIFGQGNLIATTDPYSDAIYHKCKTTISASFVLHNYTFEDGQYAISKDTRLNSLTINGGNQIMSVSDPAINFMLNSQSQFNTGLHVARNNMGNQEVSWLGKMLGAMGGAMKGQMPSITGMWNDYTNLANSRLSVQAFASQLQDTERQPESLNQANIKDTYYNYYTQDKKDDGTRIYTNSLTIRGLPLQQINQMSDFYNLFGYKVMKNKTIGTIDDLVNRYLFNYLKITNFESAINKTFFNTKIIGYFNEIFKTGIRIWELKDDGTFKAGDINNYEYENWETIIAGDFDNETKKEIGTRIYKKDNPTQRYLKTQEKSKKGIRSSKVKS